MSGEILISARGLEVAFGVRGGGGRAVQAVAGIDLDILRGETLAVVGESGSGKSTLGRALLHTVPVTAGTVRFDGVDLARLKGPALRRFRRRFQMVFQDPYGSLNPRLSIGAAIAEPLVVHRLASGAALKARIAECLKMVGLDPAVASRKPHAFSGGQRQRICIARAVAARPDFIVADEAVSALDVSLQGQILDLFQDLKDQVGLTYLFISHDLGVVRQIADRVAVMYLGKVVELAPTAALYGRPRHPYTQALLAAAPTPDPALERQRPEPPLRGAPPSPADAPIGCRFHTRCPHAAEVCRTTPPPMTQAAPNHFVACHLAGAPELAPSPRTT